MASAWGLSWAVAWGGAWGTTVQAPEPIGRRIDLAGLFGNAAVLSGVRRDLVIAVDGLWVQSVRLDGLANQSTTLLGKWQIDIALSGNTLDDEESH